MKAKLEKLIRHLAAEACRLEGKPERLAVLRLLACAQTMLALKGGAE